jgi:flagellar basal-body rod modification protein FlgD
MYTENVNQIIGRAEAEFGGASGGSKGSRELDKDSFLRLLVTQLEHQDPLNPKDDTQFIAQLAQFSSLEQLTNISKGMGEIKSIFGRQDLTGAVGYIGKEVTATGYTLGKEGNQVSTLFYNLADTSLGTFANIFDGSGNLVRTLRFGPQQAGGYSFVWDGKDYAGNTLPDGVYAVAMASEGVNGQPVFVDTKVSGTVTGVLAVNGQTVLKLKDGREVSLLNVHQVINPATASTTQQEG